MSAPVFPQIFAGRKTLLQQLATSVASLPSNPSPRLVLLAGIPGIGKSTILQQFARQHAENTAITILSAAAIPPSTGSIAPSQLRPFGLLQSLVEALQTVQQKKAKKKLWLNIGLTLLTTLPFAGDLVYAIKEISRDMREYKKEAEATPTAEKLQEEYCALFQKVASEIPLVMLLDNLSWSDAESIQTLQQLLSTPSLPLLVIAAYQPDQGEVKMIETLRNAVLAATVIEVEAMTEAEIQEWLDKIFPDTSIDPAVAPWLQTHTGGIPIIIEEYLRMVWIAHHGAPQSLTVADFERYGATPSVAAHLHRLLAELPEEDQHLLQLCSAEGKEATVFLQSQLLQTDLLTTVRRLKRIQKLTGILRSRGVERRYGVQTTVFAFTHPLYHKLLFESLEYEERQAIYSHIESILRSRLEQCTTAAERMEILPHLWQYTASGDAETSSTLLTSLAEDIAAQGGSFTMAKLFEQADASGIALSSLMTADTLPDPAAVAPEQWSLLIQSIASDPARLKTLCLRLLHTRDMEHLQTLLDTLRSLPALPEDSAALLTLCELHTAEQLNPDDFAAGEQHLQNTTDPEIQLLLAATLIQRGMEHSRLHDRIEPLLRFVAETARHLTLPYQLLALLLIAQWYFVTGDPQFQSYWNRALQLGHFLQLPSTLLENAVFQNNKGAAG